MPKDYAHELSSEEARHHPPAGALPSLPVWRLGLLLSDMVAKHFLVAFGNTALAQDSDRANTYRLLALFGDAFQRVRSEYVDPVSEKELVENALKGMLTGLDPHSAYMNAEEFREMREESTGEFCGIGIEVVPENGFTKVISSMDDTPASKAGIKAGDMITR